MHTLVKHERLQMLAIAIATSVGAGIKITPFSGDFFRVGLGVSTFLISLLLMRHLSYIKTGIITAIFSVIFQGGEWMIQTGSFSVIEAVQNNFAAGVYYIVFGFGMSKFQNKLNELHPFHLGGLASMVDFFSNVTEILLRGVFLGTNIFHFEGWFLLLVIALVRSYFVIGLFSSISIRQMRILHTEQEKRIGQMLNFSAGLYGETFYLKKSMDTIERITTNSYYLYSELMENNLSPYSQQALGITQQIHEVKKDSQRIMAGLLKLYSSEIVVNMNISDILHYVTKGNQEYSEMLNKKIKIEKDVKVNYVTSQYIPLLTVLNNLVSNAVEAIKKYGTINIQVFEKDTETFFVVSNTGIGIPQKDYKIIFEPGFTTKFNDKGIAATGIGLSHVRDIVHSFEGEITVESSEQSYETTFVVRLPTAGLIKETIVDPIPQ